MRMNIVWHKPITKYQNVSAEGGPKSMVILVRSFHLLINSKANLRWRSSAYKCEMVKNTQHVAAVTQTSTQSPQTKTGVDKYEPSASQWPGSEKHGNMFSFL